MFFYSTTPQNSALTNIYYSTPVFDNTWHHTVFSMSSDGNTIRWFFDGVQITYSVRYNNGYPYLQTKPFLIGCPDSNFTGSFNMDEVIFYDRMLSVNESLSIYNSTTKTKVIRSFTIVGQNNFITPFDVSSIEILLIGGGGGGGASIGGGGGGGGFVYNSSYTVSPNTTYILNVGGGGAGDTTSQRNPVGLNGDNSTFDILISHGGGGVGE